MAGQVALADVLRFAAFSNADAGGNPMGVVFADAWPSDAEMQSLARQVGYSAVTFLVSETRGATKRWRARSFAPETEVAFSGSGAAAAGAALGEKFGKGHYDLMVNSADVGVDVDPDGERWKASFNSPRTHTRVISSALAGEFLQQFNLTTADLSANIPAGVANVGGNHLMLPVKDQATLKAMKYNAEAIKPLMRANDIATIVLGWAETAKLVHVRDAFAVGGVQEDPGTGEAAAAVGAYLRDRTQVAFDRDNNFELDIQQGDDMAIPCRLNVRITKTPGSPVRVSGAVRKIVIQPAQLANPPPAAAG